METLVDYVNFMISNEFSKSPPRIYNINMTEVDRNIIKNELNKKSEFDAMCLRSQAITILNDNKSMCIVKTSDVGKITAILFPDMSASDIPWELWMRILRAFRGYVVDESQSPPPVHILFSMHPSIRKFPEKGSAIQPSDINGGYTYSCNFGKQQENRTIVIYRAEDATRVLIHELFHYYCTDNHKLGIDIVEAETEAWAELFYCGFLSRGDIRLFEEYIKRQSVFMILQNLQLYRNGHIRSSSPLMFPWRYTVGKQETWNRWGILEHPDYFIRPHDMSSLRLTIRPSHWLKQKFAVPDTSVVL